MLPPGPERNSSGMRKIWAYLSSWLSVRLLKYFTVRRRVYENTARDNILGSAMRTV